MINEFKDIYLKQKSALILPESTGIATERQKALAMTVAANFTSLNMIMSSDMVNKLSEAQEKDIIDFYSTYMPKLKEMIGKDFESRRLFYPGFPEEVMNKDRFEIFIDQLVYAFSGLSMMPEEKPDMTYFPYLGKGIEKKMIEGTESDFDNYIKELFKRDMMYTPAEKEIIDTIVSKKANFLEYFPEEPSKAKENNIYLLQKIKEKEEERLETYAVKYLKTPTDVLRYAVTFVNGDPSLNGKSQTLDPFTKRPIGFSFSKQPKYEQWDKYKEHRGLTRNLSRREIKLIRTLLENTKMDIGQNYPQLLEDTKKLLKNEDVVLVDDAIQTHKMYWKSFAKVAHINENDGTQAGKVLGALCSDNAKTIFSLIEYAIDQKDVEMALKYLRLRPTELAKRMDKLCEIACETGKENVVIDEYRKIAEKASVTKLLQMHTQFESRKYKLDDKIISVKGVKTIKPAKEPLNRKLCETIQEISLNALKEKFKDTPYLGKIYIDKNMSKVKIPKMDKLRNATKTLYPYTFGSSLPATNTTTKQFAIAWENGNKSNPREIVDIDLSSTALYEDGHIGSVGWNSSYASSGVVYSGDIRHGGDAEFINCNLETLRKSGVVGIIPSINLYCGAPTFEQLLDCKMIIAERNDMDYGKTYEAKSVSLSLDLDMKSRNLQPLVLNVKTGEFIWLDNITIEDPNEEYSVATRQSKDIAQLVKEALQVSEFNPGFDILLKAQNCEIVDTIEEADIAFTQTDVEEDKLKEGAINITQKDYDQLLTFLDETRTDIEKEIETQR